MILIKTFTIFYLQFVCATDNNILIQLQPEQILNTFQSVISSDYLRTLASDFTKKAAEHLISEMKNKEQQLALDYRSPEKKNLLVKELVNKQQVLTLLREPSPDGDNLEDELVLSDEEGTTTKDSKVKIPLKINGAYYKRYLD